MRPIHLIGHYSRTFKGMIISACSPQGAIGGRHLRSYERLTTDRSEVTCKFCLRLMAEGKELDPITRKHEPDHPSCVKEDKL